MYSYIIKTNSKRIPTLIKRKDGDMICHTYITCPTKLNELYSKAIVHDSYAILYYADNESSKLDNLFKGTL
jgi:hypothetical protein